MAIARGHTYIAAGADLLFVPGLTDPTAAKTLVRELDSPVSLMFIPGMASPAEFFDAGVKRLSRGAFAMQTTYDTLSDVANEVLRGNWRVLDPRAMRA